MPTPQKGQGMSPPPPASRKSEGGMESSPRGRYTCCLDRVSSCAPTRVSLFNLSLLGLPLLVVLLNPSFVSSFVVIAPSTKSWPLTQWRGGSSTTCSVSMHQRSRSSGVQNQRDLLPLPAPTAAAAGAERRGKMSRESGTRRHALQDEILEGIAAAVTPAAEVN